MTSPVDWVAIADQLATSLRAMPCRCQMVGKASWHTRAQAVVALKCSRCLALEAYDAIVVAASSG